MLHVAVVTNIEAGGEIVVTLIVLVEGVGKFEAVRLRGRPFRFCAPREIAITVVFARIEIALAEKVARASGKTKVVGRLERYALLHLPSVAAENVMEGVFGVIDFVAGINPKEESRCVCVTARAFDHFLRFSPHCTPKRRSS